MRLAPLTGVSSINAQTQLYRRLDHGNANTAARYDYALRLERWMNHFLMEGESELPPYEIDHASRMNETND